MNGQLTLEVATPRLGPDERQPLSHDQEMVLAEITRAGITGLTCFEMQGRLATRGIVRDRNCLARRCTDLAAAGLIFGVETDRGKNDRPATAWVAVQ